MSSNLRRMSVGRAQGGRGRGEGQGGGAGEGEGSDEVNTFSVAGSPYYSSGTTTKQWLVYQL